LPLIVGPLTNVYGQIFVLILQEKDEPITLFIYELQVRYGVIVFWVLIA